MNIMNRFKSKKNRSELNSDEGAILLFLKDGHLTISVDLAEDIDPKIVGAVIGAVANGELTGVILQQTVEYMKNNGMEDEITEMQQVVRDRIAHHQQTIKSEGVDEPLIQPIDAIRKQLTMYQPQ